MDDLNGLLMYYLNYPTLKFVANMNLMMMEPEQKMQLSDKHNITEPLQCHIVSDA